MKVDQPCCSPRHHSPVEIIFINKTNSVVSSVLPEYYDVNKVLIKDLIVNHCSCS